MHCDIPLDILSDITSHHSPYHIYNEDGIRQTCQTLSTTFHSITYTNFFAVKANPNPHILKIVLSEGQGLDCSSEGELYLAEKLGAKGDNIMYTSNNTQKREFVKACKLNARITFDDTNHIEFYEKSVLSENLVPFKTSFACRYNPGDAIHFENSKIIGDPKESKFGMTRSQLFDAYAFLKKKDVDRFGFHCMMISNERNSSVFVEIVDHVSQLVDEIQNRIGIQFEYINFGGGMGIPYHPDHKQVDLNVIYQEFVKVHSKFKCKIFQENGRFITGPHGYLIAKVNHIKTSFKKYIGINANMCDLMRPGMYGAYHHITVPGRTGEAEKCDVVGSLCENNDKFAIDRMLPNDIQVDDLIIIFCTGAHGYCMGNNYNSKLKHAEYLWNKSGYEMIRRPETFSDIYATICNFDQ